MKLFTHLTEPWGTIIFRVDSAEAVEVPEVITDENQYIANRAKAGYIDLSGVVVEGGFTSRLFQHTHYTSYVGRPYSVSVPPESFAAGFHRSIAM